MAQRTNKTDERKARARYMDQPGQWTNTTSKATKKRQDKEMEKLVKMMSAKKSVKRK